MKEFIEIINKKLPSFYKAFFVLHCIYNIIALWQHRATFEGGPNAILSVVMLVIFTGTNEILKKDIPKKVN